MSGEKPDACPNPECKSEEIMIDKSQVPAWCKVVDKLPEDVHGAGGSAEFDGREMAHEALGERTSHLNSGLVAFAYLWRRFGPPVAGSDPHKEVCCYIIGTPSGRVFLDLAVKGMELSYCVRYLATRQLRDEMYAAESAWHAKIHEWAVEHGYESAMALMFSRSKKSKADYDAAIAAHGIVPRPDHAKWREDSGPLRELNGSIYAALRELTRPVYVRDVPINVFGRVTDEDADDWEPAEPSRYAGYGVDLKPIDAMIAEDAK